MKKVKTLQRWNSLSGEVGGSISGDIQANYLEKIQNKLVAGLDILPNPSIIAKSFEHLWNPPSHPLRRYEMCSHMCS